MTQPTCRRRRRSEPRRLPNFSSQLHKTDIPSMLNHTTHNSLTHPAPLPPPLSTPQLSTNRGIKFKCLILFLLFLICCFLIHTKIRVLRLFSSSSSSSSIRGIIKSFRCRYICPPTLSFFPLLYIRFSWLCLPFQLRFLAGWYALSPSFFLARSSSPTLFWVWLEMLDRASLYTSIHGSLSGRCMPG